MTMIKRKIKSLSPKSRFLLKRKPLKRLKKMLLNTPKLKSQLTSLIRSLDTFAQVLSSLKFLLLCRMSKPIFSLQTHK